MFDGGEGRKEKKGEERGFSLVNTRRLFLLPELHVQRRRRRGGRKRESGAALPAFSPSILPCHAISSAEGANGEREEIAFWFLKNRRFLRLPKKGWGEKRKEKGGKPWAFRLLRENLAAILSMSVGKGKKGGGGDPLFLSLDRQVPNKKEKRGGGSLLGSMSPMRCRRRRHRQACVIFEEIKKKKKKKKGSRASMCARCSRDDNRRGKEERGKRGRGVSIHAVALKKFLYKPAAAALHDPHTKRNGEREEEGKRGERVACVQFRCRASPAVKQFLAGAAGGKKEKDKRRGREEGRGRRFLALRCCLAGLVLEATERRRGKS